MAFDLAVLEVYSSDEGTKYIKEALERNPAVMEKKGALFLSIALPQLKLVQSNVLAKLGFLSGTLGENMTIDLVISTMLYGERTPTALEASINGVPIVISADQLDERAEILNKATNEKIEIRRKTRDGKRKTGRETQDFEIFIPSENRFISLDEKNTLVANSLT